MLIGGATNGAVSSPLVALLGTGLCGALSTYSTFGYETIRLFEDAAPLLQPGSLLNAAVSVVAGLGAAFVGVSLAAIWP